MLLKSWISGKMKWNPRIWILALLLVLVTAMGKGNGTGMPLSGDSPEDRLKAERLRMVDEQIRRRGIKDARVLKAMEEVPRHRFVNPGDVAYAHNDSPLPIGLGQTISQPYIVALMTETLRLKPSDRVLEIGTGSGYQAAVLSVLVDSVYTIEILGPLGRSAKKLLKSLGYRNVRVRIGDGYRGWPEEAPFDAIIVTAAPDTVPQALIDQLADGGRMVIPVGERIQELLYITRDGKKIKRDSIASVRFVPMVSEEE
jgi:protein-L-isoaspartate(D-aspartate) O-methyltransferase